MDIHKFVKYVTELPDKFIFINDQEGNVINDFIVQSE